MQLGFQMLPKNDGNITIVYGNNNNVRQIRMNDSHPTQRVSLPMGDSVGHWEGEVLVIDTVGIKTDGFTSADRFGTTQSEAMHVIERYRLIDGAFAKAAQEKAERRKGLSATATGSRVSIPIRAARACSSNRRWRDPQVVELCGSLDPGAADWALMKKGLRLKRLNVR